MNKLVLFILLALSSAPALSSDNSQIGKVTRLMTKDLPDLPGKEGMVETVDFAPGEVSQPHRHNADLFVYVLEGSIITQVKVVALRQFTPAKSFTNRPRMYTS